MLFSTWSVDSSTGIISQNNKNTSSSCSDNKNSKKYQTIIGLEIHAQLDIPTKLFSNAPISQSSTIRTKPNSCVHPFDLGVPGFLPRLSYEAVQSAILIGAATKCSIQSISRFERKHYFYADSPLGYQVTQQRWPIAKNGILTCHRSPTNSNKSKKKKKKKSKGKDDSDDDTFSVRIERIQLEQDTGKTIMTTRNNVTKSMVDFNRAGSALVEIVFHPDLRSPIDASIAVETLRNLLRYIGTCDGKMEEGSLRCDLNVSIAPIDIDDDENDDASLLLLSRCGNRVEVKNLNSIRQIQLAAEYEAIRQVNAIEIDDCLPTKQETRTFDIKSGKTNVIRSKEGAKDYRFMPEPDLPPLILNEKAFGGIPDLETFLAINLPELPEDARVRLQHDYGLSDYISNVMTGDPPAIQMFDEAVQEARNQLTNGGGGGDDDNATTAASKRVPASVANLLCNELFALVREHESTREVVDDSLESENSVKYSKVNAKQLGEVVALLESGTISNTMAKQLLRILYTEEIDGIPREVANNKGFQLISDPTELASICRKVISDSPKELERYRLGGKYSKKIIKFFLGKTMAASRGNAHPERLNEVLMEVLLEVAPDVDTSS